MVTDVAQGGGTQQSVAQGMDGHVGVAMAQQPLLPGDIHSSEPQFTALDKPMDVKSIAHAHHHIS